MKIKINNILKKFIKKDKNIKEAKLIKFNANVMEKEEIKQEENDEVKIRKGATVENKKSNTNNIRKIFIGMIMLLVLTISLNIRYKDYLKIDKYEPKEVSSVAVTSNVDNNEPVTATKAEEKVVTTPKVEKLIFIPALDGEVQKIYSTDKVVYSKTLHQWKTHDGIDISAENNKTVVAIERGVVEKVYNDSFYGMTVEIEHINGYRSVYSNLEENVYVNVGESVIKGQKLGKVGNTAIGEYLDEPHLHFVLFQNDKNINPTYIFN